MLSGRRWQVVFVENAVGRLAADDAAEQAAQLDRIVDAEVQAQPAERIVDVRGVAGEEHAALAEARRDALMHVVEIAVDDVVGAVLGQESLQARSVASGFISSSSVCSGRVDDSTRHSGPRSSPLTLNSENQASGSEM